MITTPTFKKKKKKFAFCKEKKKSLISMIMCGYLVQPQKQVSE